MKTPQFVPKSRLREQLILRVISRAVIPFILLFALYVQFHGDFGPGGGFQAGVIFASAFILYGLVYNPDRLRIAVPERAVEILIAVGVLIYGGVGVLCLLLGYEFLDYDAFGSHGQHHGILAIEVGVGITVAATMTRLFYAFADLMPSEATENTSGED